MTAKNAASVVVRRSDDGATVTIPFSMLSAADIEYVKAANDADLAKLSAGTGDGGAACATLIASFPKLAIQDDNDTQLLKKYSGWVRQMHPDNARALVEIIRKKLPDDVKYWTNEANSVQSTKPNGSTLNKSFVQQSALFRNRSAAIQSRITWLTQTLPNWLDQVEKAAP